MDRMNEAVESPLGNLVLDFVHSLYMNTRQLFSRITAVNYQTCTRKMC